MSDFASPFWDYYISIITVVSVIGCGLFLWSQSKRRVKVGAGPDPDTTGHVWDGDLQEFHNPLPRWWMWLFYLTVVFALVYLVLYPGLGAGYKGMLGWSSAGQYQVEVKSAAEKYEPIFAQYQKMEIPAVARDPRALQMGARIFLNNCAQCHGSDARGGRGFPNLTDGEWQWGGSPEAIVTTITDGRTAVMPPMAAAIGGGDNVTDVANYVLSLSGSAHDSVRAARGKEKFAVCAACHGPEGKGNPAIGSLDLTNKIWLYGGTVTTISETINKGRSGVMPPWKNSLSPAEIHLVAAYVYSLSGPGQGAAAPQAPATK